jgi:hypothetical protein
MCAAARSGIGMYAAPHSGITIRAVAPSGHRLALEGPVDAWNSTYSRSRATPRLPAEAVG